MVNLVKKHFLLVLVVVLIVYIFLNNQINSVFYGSLNSGYKEYSNFSSPASVGSMANSSLKGILPSRESVDVATPDRKK